MWSWPRWRWHLWLPGCSVEATVESWASTSLRKNLEVHQALNPQIGAPKVWNCTGLQMLMPQSGPWTRWQQCHPLDWRPGAACRRRGWAEEYLQMGKGKPVFQAFCKTEPAAPCSSGYNKSGVTASPFPSFKYRRAYRNHRIKQEGLWLCSPTVGRDRSALAWLIP